MVWTILDVLSEAECDALIRRVDALKPEAAPVALLFTHCVLHEGCEVTRGVKYVVRSDVMYRERVERLRAVPASEAQAAR